MPGPKSLVVVFFFFLWTFLSTTLAQVSHLTPRNQLKRRQSTKSAGGFSDNKYGVPRKPFIPNFDWEQEQYLKAHNDLRIAAGVPVLQWHPDLTNSSHYWAHQLLDACDYRSHSHGEYGENIFWSLYRDFTPVDVVRKWYSEMVHFDHTTNLCKCQPETDKCECGHYLNVIWKTTQWMGCSGAFYCKEAKGSIVVCQYNPPGNYKGENPLNPLIPSLSLNVVPQEAEDKHAPPSPIHTGKASGHHSRHPPINSNKASGHHQSPTPVNRNKASGHHPSPTPVNTLQGPHQKHHQSR